MEGMQGPEARAVGRSRDESLTFGGIFPEKSLRNNEFALGHRAASGGTERAIISQCLGAFFHSFPTQAKP